MFDFSAFLALLRHISQTLYESEDVYILLSTYHSTCPSHRSSGYWLRRSCKMTVYVMPGYRLFFVYFVLFVCLFLVFSRCFCNMLW